MHIIKTIIAAMLLNIAVFTQGQKCTETPVLLDPVFNKAIELSAIAWVGDSVYMPTAKCGLVFIGKIEGQKMTYRVQVIKKRNYEGMAYRNNRFYLSDDSRATVYVYNRAFEQIDNYAINLGSNEGINGNNGFEGIAVLNDTTFYILLEKAPGKNYSILYKAILRGRQLNIMYKKYLPVEEGGRYCDLLYRDYTLYLLKSCFRSNDCDTFQNTYEIMKLNLSNSLDVEDKNSKIEPALHLSLTNCVLKRCRQHSTNIEGITMDADDNFYIVSDNFNGNPACEQKGEKGTLLMRITNQ